MDPRAGVNRGSMDLKRDLERYIDIEKIKEILADETKRTYIILASAVLFAGLYLFLLVIPAAGSFFNVSRSSSELKDRISLVDQRLARIDEFTEKLAGLRDEYEGYSAQLPAQKEISRFLEGLAATAKASDVTILSVMPRELRWDKDGATAGYYAELPVVITAKSGYHQLGRFVDDLEKGSRFTTIQDIRVSYDPRMPRRHDVNMVLKVYISMDGPADDK